MDKKFRLNIFIFAFLLLCVFPANTTVTPTSTLDLHVNATWHNFSKFIDARKGANFSGMSQLKKYFHRFGYLNDTFNNFTDIFDDTLETAVLNYQKKLGLPITGVLDSSTVTKIMSPRCGISDNIRIQKFGDHVQSHFLHTLKHSSDFKHYVYASKRYTFDLPKWDDQPLITYAFSVRYMINYQSFDDIQDAFRRSFSRWASITPLNFTEVDDYRNADIKIGFYEGDHGDGDPFDGVLGVLAHAFPREIHFDEAETWAVDFKVTRSNVAVDLESIATHEIGHVLGLGHSSVEEAVMYPYFYRGVKKANLNVDDVKGIQRLYGPNPNTPSVESDFSSGYRPGVGRWVKWVTMLGLFARFLF